MSRLGACITGPSSTSLPSGSSAAASSTRVTCVMRKLRATAPRCGHWRSRQKRRSCAGSAGERCRSASTSMPTLAPRARHPSIPAADCTSTCTSGRTESSTRWCPRWDSNPHCEDFKSPASAIGLLGRNFRGRCWRRPRQEHPVKNTRPGCPPGYPRSGSGQYPCDERYKDVTRFAYVGHFYALAFSHIRNTW